MRIVVVILLVCCSTTLGGPRSTDRMFRRALEEAGGPSPLYLLFTLNDPVKHTRRVVSVPATGLVGAIHFEYQLDFDTAGRTKPLVSRLHSRDTSLRFTVARRCTPFVRITARLFLLRSVSDWQVAQMSS